MIGRALRSGFVNRYTWQIEASAVASVLLAVLAVKGFSWTELAGSAAVFVTFMHAQVADRLADSQADMEMPSVECWRWARRYFVGKEALWFVYFLAMKAWAALAGVLIFLLYPYWRKVYRAANMDGGGMFSV